MTPECFGGVWIGESMREGDGEPHTVMWNITQRGASIFIYPSSGEDGAGTGYFSGAVSDDGLRFELFIIPGGHAAGRLLDADHFLMPNWDAPEGSAPADMVFSRPGLAELRSRAVWAASKDAPGS
jgi:hypothetical protein